MDDLKKLICNRIDQTVGELMRTVDCLYGTAFHYDRYCILNHMKCKIQELEFIARLLCLDQFRSMADRAFPSPELPLQETSSPETPLQDIPSPGKPSTQRFFTTGELQQFDGKNGRPGYVGVDGVVYDITDNATWAAATHFGLSAGKDLTDAFASCHSGQPVLSKLRVVGKLIG